MNNNKEEVTNNIIITEAIARLSDLTKGESNNYKMELWTTLAIALKQQKKILLPSK